MSRTWKVYTGNPVNPSYCTLQSSLPDPPSTIAKLEARETPDIISYLPLYGYLFCTVCRSAIPRKVLLNHLQRHHGISSGLSTTILRQYEHVPVAQEDLDIVPLPNDSRVLPFLAAPVQGFSCPHCIWLTVNWGEFRKHLSKTHSQRHTIVNRRDVSCFLQQWVAHRKTGQYWRVNHTRTDSVESVEADCEEEQADKERLTQLEEACRDPDMAELLRMEDEEEHRLANEANANACLPDKLEHDENTRWLRECGWPRWFARKPLHVIVATSQLPSKKHEALYLGPWNGSQWSSCSATETKLLVLVELVGRVLDRCEETLSSTPRVLRCWLRSWGPHYCPIPFEQPKRQTTQKKYRSYCYRFLCYVFRARQVCFAQGYDTNDIYGLTLTAFQAEITDTIWAGLDNLLPSEAERVLSSPSSPPPPPSSSILETIFQLLVLFWTDTSIDGDAGAKALIHFSGVLGIHPYKLTLRTPYDYTPYLSALIWVGRLVILEYALPSRAYSSWNPLLQARTAHPDQGSRLLREIRPRYLQCGTFAPLGYFIERLQHGRAVAKREGGRTNISWSPDGQMLEVNGSQITLTQLRSTVHSLLDAINREARDLMFQWWPDVNLREIKDKLTSYRAGYSFLAEPENNLQMSFKHLYRRAFFLQEGRLALQGAGRQQAMAYLQRRDDFIRLIFAGIHMTSGMPARGEELRIIRWANTVAVQRNIIIHKGHIMLVFTYNKVSTTANHSFYIIRVPCPIVERALFLYLAYIRPFTDFLLRQLKLIDARTKTNLHLFTLSNHPTGCFSAVDCSKSLELATPDCPIRLQLCIYRHIAVAISKKHILTLLEPFDPNIPKDQNGFLHLLAFQTGHTPSIHASAYALERGYPARLQPELIERYFENSLIWHRFLEIDEDRPIDREANPGPLDPQIKELMTPTMKPANQAVDVGVSEEESFALHSGDEKVAEAKGHDRRLLTRSKRRLSSDLCNVLQNQSVSNSARLKSGGVSISCTSTGVRYTKRRKG